MGQNKDRVMTYAEDITVVAEELATTGSSHAGAKEPELVNSLVTQLLELEIQVREQEDQIAVLKEAARSDALTGLANRRVFDQEMHRTLSAAKRYKRLGALMILDLNGFKGINDQLGHAVGDHVLQHVSKLLMQNTRPTDVVARLGGDEFAVILNEVSSSEDVEKRAVALRTIIEGAPCMIDGRSLQLSISVGAHTFGDGETMEEIFDKADMRMYAEKSSLKK